MARASDQCPKHGTSYLLRGNVKTGEIAIACPLCNVETRGGSDEDRKLVADQIKSRTSGDWSLPIGSAAILARGNRLWCGRLRE